MLKLIKAKKSLFITTITMVMPVLIGMTWFGLYPKHVHYYPDRVLPSVTGGFGELSCHSCHFDGALNSKKGSMTLSGLPEIVKTDSTYTLEVALIHPDLEKAGFQLSVRTEDGNQYGVFQTIDDRTLIQSSTDDSIQYMNHSKIGSEVDEGKANWKFKWTAGSGTGNIVFNLAGNAANGDASEFGDAIYVYEIVLVSRD